MRVHGCSDDAISGSLLDIPLVAVMGAMAIGVILAYGVVIRRPVANECTGGPEVGSLRRPPRAVADCRSERSPLLERMHATTRRMPTNASARIP